tara:strand:+ start:35 stop:514 length:480 start_codon:yes stop_codon:yes gene_type:complete
MSDRIDRAVAKAILASEGAAIGGAIGSMVAPGLGTAVGATVGAGVGLVYGDETMVFMEPMIAIPARQEYLLNGAPDVKVYIRAGESLLPTGGNVTDVQEVAVAMAPAKKKRRKANAWITFNKRFNYRAKRKSESSQAYLKARTKAAVAAYKRSKKGGKK